MEEKLQKNLLHIPIPGKNYCTVNIQGKGFQNFKEHFVDPESRVHT